MTCRNCAPENVVGRGLRGRCDVCEQTGVLVFWPSGYDLTQEKRDAVAAVEALLQAAKR